MRVLVIVIGVLNFGLGYMLAVAFGYGLPGWYFLQRLVLRRAPLVTAMRPVRGVQQIVSGLTGP